MLQVVRHLAGRGRLVVHQQHRAVPGRVASQRPGAAAVARCGARGAARLPRHWSRQGVHPRPRVRAAGEQGGAGGGQRQPGPPLALPRTLTGATAEGLRVPDCVECYECSV